MKKSNAWVPAVCFVATLGFLIGAMLRDGESGETGLWIACAISAVATVVSWLNLKSAK